MWPSKIDKFHKLITDCYASNKTPDFIQPFIVETKEDKERLNKVINLSSITGVDSKYVINHLLNTNFPLAQLLIQTPDLDLEINYSDEHNLSVFKLLFEGSDGIKYGYITKRTLIVLLTRGYQISESDKIYLTAQFKKSKTTEELFLLWAFFRAAVICNDDKKLELLELNDGVFRTLLSSKLKRPIGYAFTSLQQIANNAFQSYGKSGDLILKSMSKFGVYDVIISQDKKGTFKNKMENYYKFKPIQNSAVETLFLEVFPELSMQA
jgi:hypothetical protein